jgi:transposase-like protein
MKLYNCIKCAGKMFSRSGFDSKGMAQYKCRGCGKYVKCALIKKYTHLDFVKPSYIVLCRPFITYICPVSKKEVICTKFGKTSYGKQRYKCIFCGHIFTTDKELKVTHNPNKKELACCIHCQKIISQPLK